MFTAKIKRFLSLLILLLSDGSIRVKWLKTTHTEERISLALDFRTFLEKMKMSFSLSKILGTGINFSKVTLRSWKLKKYYEISTIYECVEKKSMIIVCNNWIICLELNWFVYDPSCMLRLSEFVWKLRSSVYKSFLTIFSTLKQQIEGY